MRARQLHHFSSRVSAFERGPFPFWIKHLPIYIVSHRFVGVGSRTSEYYFVWFLPLSRTKRGICINTRKSPRSWQPGRVQGLPIWDCAESPDNLRPKKNSTCESKGSVWEFSVCIWLQECAYLGPVSSWIWYNSHDHFCLFCFACGCLWILKLSFTPPSLFQLNPTRH